MIAPRGDAVALDKSRDHVSRRSGAGRTGEWRRGWILVLSGLAGMSISGLVPYSLGLFMEPLTAAFGWSRGLLSIGPTIIAMFGVLLTPLVGIWSDRYGPRAIALPGVVLASLAFAAFGLTSRSTAMWILLWSLYSIVFVAVKPLVWSAAVSHAFDRSRGLALAVTLSGVAVSQTLTPILAEWLIRTQGWRQAFFWLGLGWGGIVLVIVLLFFRLPPTADAPAHVHPAAGVAPANGRWQPSVLDGNIAKIAVASFLLAAVGAGVAVHKVPILAEFGISRATAAWLAASAGVSGILGKVVMGWLVDHTRGHPASALGIGITGLGTALLLLPGHPYPAIMMSMFILGFGAGAGLQVTVYLVSRFAGAERFGRAFGIVNALTAVGAGAGPWLFGESYAVFHAYGPALIASVPICLICGALILTLAPLTQRPA